MPAPQGLLWAGGRILGGDDPRRPSPQGPRLGVLFLDELGRTRGLRKVGRNPAVAVPPEGLPEAGPVGRVPQDRGGEPPGLALEQGVRKRLEVAQGGKVRRDASRAGSSALTFSTALLFADATSISKPRSLGSRRYRCSQVVLTLSFSPE